MATVPQRWKKSTRSSSNTNCVEVRHDLAAVRDSKNPGGPMLEAFAAALVVAVRDGRVGR